MILQNLVRFYKVISLYKIERIKLDRYPTKLDGWEKVNDEKICKINEYGAGSMYFDD